MSDYPAAPSTHIAFPGDSSELHNREHRRKAFKAGIVSYQNHALTMDCVIRDVSSGGVKQQFPKAAMVPDNFTLTIPMEGQRVECQARWRKGNVIGAVFVGEMERYIKSN